jgi:hypothetical protein
VRDDELNMRRIAKELRASSPRVDRSFDDRVMAIVRSLPRHARQTLWSRLNMPRTFTVKPLGWSVLAASVALLAIFGVNRAVDDVRVASKPIVAAVFPKTATPAVKPPQRVQFVLVAPEAKKVAVVGDFNGWDASHASYQAQHRGGGVWSVTAPVPLGHHRYSFVVDDSVWVTDPMAPRVADNDYGVANSAIVVEEQK